MTDISSIRTLRLDADIAEDLTYEDAIEVIEWFLTMFMLEQQPYTGKIPHHNAFFRAVLLRALGDAEDFFSLIPIDKQFPDTYHHDIEDAETLLALAPDCMMDKVKACLWYYNQAKKAAKENLRRKSELKMYGSKVVGTDYDDDLYAAGQYALGMGI
jgi:hypothetical protein